MTTSPTGRVPGSDQDFFTRYIGGQREFVKTQPATIRLPPGMILEMDYAKIEKRLWTSMLSPTDDPITRAAQVATWWGVDLASHRQPGKTYQAWRLRSALHEFAFKYADTPVLLLPPLPKEQRVRFFGRTSGKSCTVEMMREAGFKLLAIASAAPSFFWSDES